MGRQNKNWTSNHVNPQSGQPLYFAPNLGLPDPTFIIIVYALLIQILIQLVPVSVSSFSSESDMVNLHQQDTLKMKQNPALLNLQEFHNTADFRVNLRVSEHFV